MKSKFIEGKTRISYGGALIGKEEKKAINAVINSQGGRRWTIGEESIALEKELAEVVGVKHAILTNSGSSALLVAMTALHLPRGQKVIIPAVNFPTAFNAILQCGLVPVVVDVDLETLNLKLDDVKKMIETVDDIRAVIAVDIAGNPVDLSALREIVGDNISIILDNADGFGCTLHNQFIDTYADVSCVSFHAAHIITMGEGGAVLTDNDEYAKRSVMLREWGRVSGTDKIYQYQGFPDDYKERYVFEEIGFNMKPLELQCAMGRVQLKKLQTFKEARSKNHALLFDAFKFNPRFKLLRTIPDSDPCWFSFAMLCNTPRKQVMEEFEKNNIECRTIFSGNILRHPAYIDSSYIKMVSLDNADEVMKRGMFLSCHPLVTKEMIDFIKRVADNL